MNRLSRNAATESMAVPGVGSPCAPVTRFLPSDPPADSPGRLSGGGRRGRKGPRRAAKSWSLRLVVLHAVAGGRLIGFRPGCRARGNVHNADRPTSQLWPPANPAVNPPPHRPSCAVGFPGDCAPGRHRLPGRGLDSLLHNIDLVPGRVLVPGPEPAPLHNGRAEAAHWPRFSTAFCDGHSPPCAAEDSRTFYTSDPSRTVSK